MNNPPGKKADFSDVTSTATSTETRAADFSNVRSGVSSTEQPADGIFGAPSQTYTVVAGDTLSHIAKRMYGKASRWPQIFEANRDQLDDPDRIRPGQVLTIPADDAASR
jgi:nucleoid-associated protein YgaU